MLGSFGDFGGRLWWVFRPTKSQDLPSNALSCFFFSNVSACEARLGDDDQVFSVRGNQGL